MECIDFLLDHWSGLGIVASTAVSSGRVYSRHELGLPFVGFLVVIMANSIFYTWLYNNTEQSLWSAILFHWLFTYATLMVYSGVTRSPLYNWLECLPYVIMALFVPIIWQQNNSLEIAVGSE